MEDEVSLEKYLSDLAQKSRSINQSAFHRLSALDPDEIMLFQKHWCTFDVRHSRNFSQLFIDLPY